MADRDTRFQLSALSCIRMADIVYWVQDLLFVSKIREVAQQLQLAAASVRDAQALIDSSVNSKIVIVDLRIPAAVDALERLPASLPKVGFIDHERTDVMERAESLGCRALAKGKFSTELPRILAEL
jgi:hypothetical protein